jgi:hypothetical protein
MLLMTMVRKMGTIEVTTVIATVMEKVVLVAMVMVDLVKFP